MTTASQATFAGWSEPDKVRIQKQMLDALQRGPMTFPLVFGVCGVSHQTGTARLQELTDMGLVVPRGEVKRQSGPGVLSKFVLSALGQDLMIHPNKDDLLMRMNKTRREYEVERADAMRQIRIDHVNSVRESAAYILATS